MRSFIHAAGIIAIASLPLSLAAQWPTYQNPAAPRLPDGRVNLTAPAPRMADGKPDLSGIWLNGRGGQPARGQAPAAGAAAGARGAGAPTAPAPSPFSEGPPVATFRDVGANFKDG